MMFQQQPWFVILYMIVLPLVVIWLAFFRGTNKKQKQQQDFRHFYVPKLFEPPKQQESILQIMQQNNFALLQTWNAEHMYTSHIPFLVQNEQLLLGHVALKNPHAQALLEYAKNPNAYKCQVVFSGPHFYMSPKWYGDWQKEVPTWNFTAAHAQIASCTILNAQATMDLLQELCTKHEQLLLQQTRTKHVAKDDQIYVFEHMNQMYAKEQTRYIVAFSLQVAQCTGKWKMSQNKTKATKQSIIQGLERVGTDDALATKECIEQAM